jgi:hypothetical protein|tara:strand:- start:300 stop:596 length:297 start_codon:yes stop_codon:yes gene_type:complete
MTDKITKVLEFIKEWKDKDYEEFTSKFATFAETLELSFEDVEEISKKLDEAREWPEKSEDYKDTDEYILYASDFFVTILDDYNNNNEDEASFKYLIKE